MARLTKKQKYTAAGVGAAALLGTIGYFMYKGRAASASSSCWQPLSGPFTMVPGHYRIEMVATQQMSSTAWTQMVSAISVLQQSLPGFVVEGIWYGTYAYPKGLALPSDWPTPASAPALRLQFTSAYNATGTPDANRVVPAGVSVWKCSTGPTPPQQTLPANLATVLAQAAQAASGTVQGAQGGGQGAPLPGQVVYKGLPGGVYRPGTVAAQGSGGSGGYQPPKNSPAPNPPWGH